MSVRRGRSAGPPVPSPRHIASALAAAAAAASPAPAAETEVAPAALFSEQAGSLQLAPPPVLGPDLALVAGGRVMMTDSRFAHLRTLVFGGGDLTLASSAELREVFRALHVPTLKVLAKNLATSQEDSAMDALTFSVVAAAISVARNESITLWPELAPAVAAGGAVATLPAPAGDGRPSAMISAGSDEIKIGDPSFLASQGSHPQLDGFGVLPETHRGQLRSSGVSASKGQGPLPGPTSTNPTSVAGLVPASSLAADDTAYWGQGGLFDQSVTKGDWETVLSLVGVAERELSGLDVCTGETGKRIINYCSILSRAAPLLATHKARVEARLSCSLNVLLSRGGDALRNFSSDLTLHSMPSCVPLSAARFTIAQLVSLGQSASLHSGVRLFQELQEVLNPSMVKRMSSGLTALEKAHAMASSASTSTLAAAEARAAELLVLRKAGMNRDLEMFGFFLKCLGASAVANSFAVACAELERLLVPIEQALAARIPFSTKFSNLHRSVGRFLNDLLRVTSSVARSQGTFFSPFDQSAAAQMSVRKGSCGQFVAKFVEELRSSSVDATRVLALKAMQVQVTSMLSSTTPAGNSKGGKGRGGGGGGSGAAASAAPPGPTYTFAELQTGGRGVLQPMNVGKHQVTKTGAAAPMVRCVVHERGRLGRQQLLSPFTLVGAPGFTCASVNPGRTLVSVPGTRQDKNGVAIPATLHCCVDAAGNHLLHSFQ